MSDDEDDVFTINSFMFCAEHGHELCNECGADYRIGNNINIGDRLMNELSKGKGNHNSWDSLANRNPIANVFRLGTVYAGKNRGMKSYKCRDHSKLDCPKCFDWVKVIAAQAKVKDKGKVIDRTQILGFLKSMDVELPPSITLPDDALERKLSAALSYAQSIPSLGIFPVNPSTLTPWPAMPEKSLFDTMKRSSLREAMNNYTANLQGKASGPALHEDAFMDVRQTVMHLAHHYDNGFKACILQDKECKEAICIRILEVRKINAETPIILMLYETGAMSSPVQNTFGFVQHLMQTGMIRQINCTTQEQALLRKLLFENSQRVSSDYKPKKEEYERTFKISFILPIGPLTQVDVGKLTLNTGCEVCGEKVVSRCSQCQSVSYCGAECQKADWKNHKSFCKSLKDATWETMDFVTEIIVDGKKLHMAYVNSLGPTPQVDTPSQDDMGKAPPNIHDDKPFIVKLQKLLTTGPWEDPRETDKVQIQSILVYDRQRSFRGHVLPKDNPNIYGKTMRQMGTGRNPLKVYRWAKRVGDFQLSVCLDRAPNPEPTW